MTDERMALIELVEKQADSDLAREMPVMRSAAQDRHPMGPHSFLESPDMSGHSPLHHK